MKKFLSFIAIAIVSIFPFAVDAAQDIAPICQDADANGNITCIVTYNFDEEIESAEVTLTEKGGAQITEVATAADSDWSMADKSEENSVWTIKLSSVGVSGEGDLFTFTYTPSGEDDCKISIALKGTDKKVDVIPDEDPTPETDDKTPEADDTDQETDNKETGAAVPYIALGVIALGAGLAYVATKNKAKIYKI